MPQTQKHPKGLYLLFITEMAERFSYFGMCAILTLYMVAALFSMDKAFKVYGTFASLVYLTPLIGGYIADRFWGNRRSIVTGGVFMAVGQFFLFLSACFVKQSIFVKNGDIDPSIDNSLSLILLYCGLSFLIIGNGLFKPNIATMVGDLYDQKDKRKESAFTIFYMGINIGALIAPLACGAFEGDFSNPGRFRWGFLVACIAITTSVIIFIKLKRHFLVTPEGVQIGLPPTKITSKDNKKYDSLTSNDYVHMLVIIILAVFTIAFWVAFGQAAVSLTIFADNHTDKVFGGWEMPTSWFQMFPALFCVLLAPVMNYVWEKLGKYEPHAVNKLSIGLLAMAIGYLIIANGTKGMTDNTKVSALWLIGLYFIFEIGELSLSPIGLSLVSKLSPKRFASLMMAIWYLSTSVSNYLAGQIATLYPDSSSDPKTIFGYEITTLHDFFLVFVILSGISAFILYAISPIIKRMMRD